MRKMSRPIGPDDEKAAALLAEIPEIVRKIEDRLKRLEDLSQPKPKKKPKKLRFDPKPVLATMREKGWNQADLSRRSGIAKDRISVWLSGKNSPSPKHLVQLAQFVDIV